MAKIAYLVSCYPAVSTTFILREVLLLREKGHQIEVASINAPPPPEGGWPEVEEAELARTFIVKKSNPFRALWAVVKTAAQHPIRFVKTIGKALWWSGGAPKRVVKMGAYFLQACLVGQWARSRGLEHLHVHFGNAGATVGLLTTNLFSIPYTLTIHGPDIFFDVEGFLLKEKISAAKWVACISQYCRAQLLLLTGPEMEDKLRVLPLGVDTNVYSPVANRSNSSPLHLVSIGRAVRAKGGYDLLYALAELRKQQPHATLTYVGDGPELSSMKAFAERLGIADSVTFTGALGRLETHEKLSRADIFVLPSYGEGLPVALMEAMSLEVPCVSTYIAGIPELIHHNQNGLLVPAGSRERLVEALRCLGSSAELRQVMGKEARSTVVANYCLSKNVETLHSQFLHTQQGSENS